MTTFVLIHGSWHGGWAWDTAKTGLLKRGHSVVTPCLVGLGSKTGELTPEIGLWSHVGQIAELVEESELSDLVLVGHSYGGTVIHALEPRLADRLRAVVHLEGAILQEGQCVRDTWPMERQAETDRRMRDEGDGWRVPPPEPKTAWPELSAAQAAELRMRLTPQSMQTYLDTMKARTVESECPHYYLYASDRVPQPYARVIEHFRNEPNWQLAATTGGHELMFTNPAAVMRVLEIAEAQGRLPAEI